jgi:hypothetical protein
MMNLAFKYLMFAFLKLLTFRFYLPSYREYVFLFISRMWRHELAVKVMLEEEAGRKRYE